jgi:hypothetical protein
LQMLKYHVGEHVILLLLTTTTHGAIGMVVRGPAVPAEPTSLGAHEQERARRPWTHNPAMLHHVHRNRYQNRQRSGEKCECVCENDHDEKNGRQQNLRHHYLQHRQHRQQRRFLHRS